MFLCFPVFKSTFLIWFEKSWVHPYNHSLIGDMFLPLVSSTDIFIVNVPLTCPIWFLQLECVSKKLGFLPVSTNILWLCLDAE